MPEHDPIADLRLLIDAAREAGHIARRYFQSNPKIWEKDDGAGPVTEADLEVDRMLRRDLLAARPDYGWLSEETEDDPARLGKTRLFVVDPIDGTKAFIDGNTAFAHSLAVVENGTPVAAVVYLPMKERLFAAARGHGATLNSDRIQASAATDPTAAHLLATKGTMSEQHWPKGVPPIHRVYRPSLAYRMALVGEGRFDGMVTFRDTWEWDIAAGALIVEEAKGVATDGRGGALRFNNPIPQVLGVLSAAPGLHAALLQARG